MPLVFPVAVAGFFVTAAVSIRAGVGAGFRCFCRQVPNSRTMWVSSQSSSNQRLNCIKLWKTRMFLSTNLTAAQSVAVLRRFPGMVGQLHNLLDLYPARASCAVKKLVPWHHCRRRWPSRLVTGAELLLQNATACSNYCLRHYYS